MRIQSTTGSGRTLMRNLSAEEITSAQQAGTLVVDSRRQRPFYFDGRFLAARDLTRDQQYFLSRQADLCRALGSGVLDGLSVSLRSNTSLTVEAGLGVTPGGEMVVIGSEVTVDLARLAGMETLDAAFGLKAIPQPPVRNRTGLFVLALRPVEFTANPITAYPTSITGARSTEDGDIVEAVALTLVPFSADATPGDPHRQRSAAARALFGQESSLRAEGDVLPLAMLALRGGFVEWVDVYMVRRELGADHGSVVGFGAQARALREAHLVQYDRQLREVLAERAARNLAPAFSAPEYFDLLPPVGRLPAATLDVQVGTQRFFPAGIAVEVTVVPEDELGPLVEESVLLPAFDLTLPPEDIDNAAALVVIPVRRELFRTLDLRPRQRVIRFPVPGVLAGRRPLDLLRLVDRRPVPQPVPPDDASGWARALAELATLADGLAWYVRRRAISVRAVPPPQG